MSSTTKKGGAGTGTNVTLPKVNSTPNKGTGNNNTSKIAKEDPKKAASHKNTKTETTLPKITPTKERPSSTGVLSAPAATEAVQAAVPNPSEPTPNSNSIQVAINDANVATSGVDDTTIAAETVPTADTATIEVAPVALAEEKLAVNINGNVTLIYEMYNEPFPIVQGSTTAAAIDDVYCLSYVMPNCVIKLSPHPPTEKRRLEAEGSDLMQFFIFEEPRGTYQGLVADNTYYVYVEQEAAQLARDQARMKEITKSMEGGAKEGARAEGCSCIYGNPCIDQYICKDWNNRYAVATKNGWKGF